VAFYLHGEINEDLLHPAQQVEIWILENEVAVQAVWR